MSKNEPTRDSRYVKMDLWSRIYAGFMSNKPNESKFHKEAARKANEAVIQFECRWETRKSRGA